MDLKTLPFLLIFASPLLMGQEDMLYLHCAYDAPWSQLSLDGETERSLQGEIWQISESSGIWQGFNLYTIDSFPAQSYSLDDLNRDLRLLSSESINRDFRVDARLEQINLLVGEEIFVEIDRISGRFYYKDPESSVRGNCESHRRADAENLLIKQHERYQDVITNIEQTRKF